MPRPQTIGVKRPSTPPPERAIARSWPDFIDAGADPDVADREGCTPLMRLVENRRTDAALWLIDRGADTEATDQTGHRALDYATAHGLTEVVARLSTKRSDATDMRVMPKATRRLHQAVYNDQAEVVRTLLAASKAQLDAPNDAGETPLLVACGRGNLHIARMLLDAGADANRPLTNGTTPLHGAAQAGNRFLVEALLGAGAAVDARNGVGETALLVAARAGNNEVVRLLVERHAEVNAANNLQHTALYYAGERGFTEIVELLLAAGAEG